MPRALHLNLPFSKARIAHLVVEAVGTPLEHGRECPIALLNWEPDCLIFNSLKTTVQLCQLW